MWAFGCLIVYMLKGELPFINISDADIMVDIIRYLGVPSKEYLESINFKEYKKFIFPKMNRKSMRKVTVLLCRHSSAMTNNYCRF